MMRQAGMHNRAVTFLPRRTYPVVGDTWNGEVLRIPGFYVKQEKRVIAVKGFSYEFT